MRNGVIGLEPTEEAIGSSTRERPVGEEIVKTISHPPPRDPSFLFIIKALLKLPFPSFYLVVEH